MMGHLSSCLRSDNVEEAKSKDMGGLQLALSYLKADFLKEAVRVMSGSQHIADSLADLQSTLLAEKQRLDTARRAPASRTRSPALDPRWSSGACDTGSGGTLVRLRQAQVCVGVGVLDRRPREVAVGGWWASLGAGRARSICVISRSFLKMARRNL